MSNKRKVTIIEQVLNNNVVQNTTLLVSFHNKEIELIDNNIKNTIIANARHDNER